MSPIPIITHSEYVRRLKSKGFLIATVLAPVLLVGVIAIATGVGIMAQDADRRTIAVVDETGILGEDVVAALPERYTAYVTDLPRDTLAAQVRRGRIDGYYFLPEGIVAGRSEATFYSRTGGGLSGQAVLRDALAGAVREARLREMGAPEEMISVLDERIGLRTVVLTEEGEAADASMLYSGLGYAMGFIIYIAMFIYGGMVMRGVIEEKANRIVEIIASSARPFELLMGKVLGIGMAGLTQFLLWAALLLVAFAFAAPLLMALITPEMPAEAMEAAPEVALLSGLQIAPLALFAYFVLFFLGGYLLYGSLFAAVGSAVESEGDAQSLQVPISIPVILPILFLPFIADSPETTLAIILSLIPFFSPVLMPVRIAAGAAAGWEIVASLVLLAGAFVAAIWLAARIYRVGILMYGKRFGFRDLARWARYA